MSSFVFLLCCASPKRTFKVVVVIFVEDLASILGSTFRDHAVFKRNTREEVRDTVSWGLSRQFLHIFYNKRLCRNYLGCIETELQIRCNVLAHKSCPREIFPRMGMLYYKPHFLFGEKAIEQSCEWYKNESVFLNLNSRDWTWFQVVRVLSYHNS